MELTLITMLAYETSHDINDTPWRCTECEILTQHSEPDIMNHLMLAHNIDNNRLKMERDMVFMYPAKEAVHDITTT